MKTIPESHRDLVTSATVALSTVNDDGSIQTTAVWVLLGADGLLRTSLSKNRKKYDNLAARPRATVFALAPENAFHTLEVRADVEIEERHRPLVHGRAHRDLRRNPRINE